MGTHCIFPKMSSICLILFFMLPNLAEKIRARKPGFALRGTERPGGIHLFLVPIEGAEGEEELVADVGPQVASHEIFLACNYM